MPKPAGSPVPKAFLMDPTAVQRQAFASPKHRNAGWSPAAEPPPAVSRQQRRAQERRARKESVRRGRPYPLGSTVGPDGEVHHD